MSDDFEYIWRAYGLRFHKGMRVTVGERQGVVTAGDKYVHVRCDGERHAWPWHPSDVKPLDTAKANS